MVGTSSMAHGTARRVEGGLHASIRFPGLEVGHDRRRHHASLRARLARLDRLRRRRQGLPLRADRRRSRPVSRDQRVGLDGDRRQRELLPGPPRTRRAGLRLIALVFSYDVDDIEQFERVYGPEGEWAQFFRTGRGYVGTELLRDVEIPAATSSSTAGSRARPTTTSSRRTARSTCGASTRTRSATTRELRHRDVRERLVDRRAGSLGPEAGREEPADQEAGEQELCSGREAARAGASRGEPVEELRAAGPRKPDDVLDVGCTGCERADRRGVA